MGACVRRCSSPSCSMICVPDATTFPDRAAADEGLESLDEVASESRAETWECAFEHDPRQFPMAGHRVLAGRTLRAIRPKEAVGCAGGGYPEGGNAPEPQRLQRACAPPPAGTRFRACRCPRHRMCPRRGVADTSAVQHEHDRTGERRRGHSGSAVRVSPARTGSSLPIAGSLMLAMACLNSIWSVPAWIDNQREPIEVADAALDLPDRPSGEWSRPAAPAARS